MLHGSRSQKIAARVFANFVGVLSVLSVVNRGATRRRTPAASRISGVTE
jgi:hypothetical protein